MMEIIVQIRKLRFGSQGQLFPWRYDALIPDEIKKEYGISLRNLSNHENLENLALELSKLPFADNILLASYENPNGRCYSVYGKNTNYSYTQWGEITDDELAILGITIQRNLINLDR